jgi:hypothetical protein
MMKKGYVVAAMLLALSVMAGVSRQQTTLRRSLDPQGWYEQQVEEGFGHLDTLRKN